MNTITPTLVVLLQELQYVFAAGVLANMAQFMGII